MNPANATPPATPQSDALVQALAAAKTDPAAHGFWTAAGRLVAQAPEAGAEAKAAEPAAAQEHAAEPAKEDQAYLFPHEIPNVISLLESANIKPVTAILEATAPEHQGAAEEGRPEPIASFLVNPFFSILYALLAVWLVRKGLRNASIRNPGLLQTAVESLLGGLRNFYLGIMGPQGEPFVPYLGTLFIFIWMNNIAVLVPGLKSPDSSFQTTIALALTTFLYARWHNIRRLGFGGYFFHLLGSPNDTIMWIMSPLFLVLELIGEVIKPLSLGLRLFGNIMGEDKLLAVFLGLGMLIAAAALHSPHPVVGIPLHLPFFFLVVLLSTIQAVVFTTLAAIYILMMLPHEHEHEHHDDAHADHGYLSDPQHDVTEDVSPIGGVARVATEA
jgi:F-type H+-transporting ATPase subunit a